MNASKKDPNIWALQYILGSGLEAFRWFCNLNLSREHIPFLDILSDYELTTNPFSLLDHTIKNIDFA